jgi:hypothetical protein
MAVFLHPLPAFVFGDFGFSALLERTHVVVDFSIWGRRGKHERSSAATDSFQ